MLKESYLADIKNLPENTEKIVVTRSAGHILSPSWGLLNDYKSGKITWRQYEERFRKEMNNDVCVAAMRKIKWEAKTKDIFLICYEGPGKNCHRHILKKMIEELDEGDNKENEKD